MAGERDSRSMSHDPDFAEDSDVDDRNDGGQPGKPGRKKNPNSAAARRDQNRIAQREFRLRKQQRIRDLEARVEILSSSSSDTVNELRNIVKDLIAENQQLRNLIRSLGGYIGDGIGGILPSMGFDRPQEFLDFINKAETDTAFESFQKRKKTVQSQGTSSSPSTMTTDLSKKRSLDETVLSQNKRAKTSDASSNGNDAYVALLNASASANGMGSSFVAPRAPLGSFADLMQSQGSNSGMYLSGPSGDSPTHFPSPPSTAPHFPPAFHPPIAVPSTLSTQQNFLSTQTATSIAASPSNASTSTGTTPAPINLAEDDSLTDDPKILEANKLISYHLDNYKRNNAYCLPQSLRPTLVQRTVPHESVIDGIIHPELRDRMILLRGRFDLVECLHMFIRSLTLHGDDVLAHNNWEIGENWLRHFGYLVDQPVLNICNRWRRERGESDLFLGDISSAQPDIANSA